MLFRAVVVVAATLTVEPVRLVMLPVVLFNLVVVVSATLTVEPVRLVILPVTVFKVLTSPVTILA